MKGKENPQAATRGMKTEQAISNLFSIYIKYTLPEVLKVSGVRGWSR